MDYCGVGSIGDLIGQNEDKPIKLREIKDEQIASIMFSVVKGLAYLHEKGIIHRQDNGKRQLALTEFTETSKVPIF